MNKPSVELVAIVVSFVALSSLLLGMDWAAEAQHRDFMAKNAAWRAEAAADRRAFRLAMEEWRQEIRRLDNREPRSEKSL